MDRIHKIVVTGGPCGGKTTVMRALKHEFERDAMFVPEVATMLLGGGFPAPGEKLPFSEEWQVLLEEAIVPVQLAMEKAYMISARHCGKKILICDRGLFDAMAYTPWGMDEFCQRFGLDGQKMLDEYSLVIHLESLATSSPSDYGSRDNAARFETLGRAQRIELAVRTAWALHSNRIVIEGSRHGIADKIAKASRAVQDFIANFK